MSLKRKRNDASDREVCDRCWSMTTTLRGLQMLASEDGFEHYDKKQLRKSAKLGCPVCAILCYKLQIPAELTRPLRVVAVTASECRDGAASADLDHPFRSKKLVGLVIRTSINGEIYHEGIEAYTPSGDPAAAYVHALPALISVHRHDIVQKIKDRLKICQEQHYECGTQEVPILPRRIIDVEAGDASKSPRLLVNDDSKRGHYTCLSYCWGGPQEVQTNTKTIEQFSNRLPVDQLPQTIRDAITVTQSLGIRYLWVDALCILQDSTDDKSIEIEKMGRIYKSATITITAANTYRVKDGFLKDRMIPNAHQLPFFLPDSLFGTVWFRTKEYFSNIEVDPLESRGWTLQEFLLSRRVLYYGCRDLMWKCQRERFVPVNKTHYLYVEVLRQGLPVRIFNSEMHNTSPREHSQSNIWREVVETYSRRELTNFEDRLPALAGIASELQKIWNDTYLAGMWRNCLIRQLGWQRNATILKNLPFEPYRSPGWSWASSRGRILFSEVVKEHAEFVACDITPVDKTSPFGRVESGKLTLRAAVKPIPESLDVRYFGMDLGPEGPRTVDHNSRLLLLGYRPMGFGTFLIITPHSDDTYMRIGATGLSGTEMDIWQAPDLERQIVTLV